MVNTPTGTMLKGYPIPSFLSIFFYCFITYEDADYMKAIIDFIESNP